MSVGLPLLVEADFEVIHKLFEYFGEPVPSDYLCFDLETTGFSFSFSEYGKKESECADDIIVELGHCDVTDSSADVFESTVLNWTLLPEYIDTGWLKDKLKLVAEAMQERGSVFHVPYSVMAGSKAHPLEALENYVSILEDALNAGKKIVGLNVLGFDRRVFADATGEWLGQAFEIPPESIVDVGIIEKARQLKIMPKRGETLPDYLSRIRNMPVKGVRWSSDHCCEVYGLNEKYGLDDASKHSAGYDAMLCHLLMEEFKAIHSDW